MKRKFNPQRLRRVGADLAALAVAGVAARATWDHISHVGARYGESMAAWLPVSIDGMMIAGVILTVDASIMGRKRNPWAMAATWAGGLMSIAAQIESARERGAIAMAIASIFSIALIISVEAVAHGRKVVAGTTARAEQHPVDAVRSAPVPAPVSPAPAGSSRTRHTAAARKPRRAVSTRKVSLPAPAEGAEMGRVPVSPLTGRPLVAK
jgi:hypothetical protein